MTDPLTPLHALEIATLGESTALAGTVELFLVGQDREAVSAL